MPTIYNVASYSYVRTETSIDEVHGEKIKNLHQLIHKKTAQNVSCDLHVTILFFLFSDVECNVGVAK